MYPFKSLISFAGIDDKTNNFNEFLLKLDVGF